MDIHPADLRYFLTAASLGNLTRAAERLGIHQSSVSHAIRRVEAQTRARLMVRSKTGVSLTPAGQQLARRAQDLLHQWESLARTLTENETLASGKFLLGCHSTLGLHMLPSRLKKLVDTHPNLEIHLRHGLSREITADVIARKIDFGLVVNPIRHPDLVITQLAEDSVYLWRRKSGNVPPGVLILEPDLAQSQYILKQLPKVPFTVTRTIETSSLEVAASLTLEGCGTGILPRRVARYFDPTHRLEQVGRSPWVRDEICLVYRADTRKQSGGALAIIQAFGAPRRKPSR